MVNHSKLKINIIFENEYIFNNIVIFNIIIYT
ncbi:uncharacterized protein METZ01_LOCUS305184 [marine metagenome]|uniref:Uncharacterized protein n=1 Tax=marine metagenome TaxID=408172 RepID=A0A382MUW0_9ZZZZ